MYIPRISLTVFVPGDHACCLPKWAHGENPNRVEHVVVVKSDGFYYSLPLTVQEATEVLRDANDNALAVNWPLCAAEEEVLFQALISDCPDGLFQIRDSYKMEE